MAKSPQAFRTISEIAGELDVPQHVLRFWEAKFTQIRPLRRGGGRRYYRPEDVDLIRGIRRLLYSEGYTIKGVQKVLREQGVRVVAESGRQNGLAEDDAAPRRGQFELDGLEDADTGEAEAADEAAPRAVPLAAEAAPAADDAPGALDDDLRAALEAVRADLEAALSALQARLRA